MKLRILTEEGSKEFEQFVSNEKTARSNNAPDFSMGKTTPLNILTDPDLSKSFSHHLEIDENLQLKTKRDLIVPLIKLFKNVDLTELQSNKPLWDWISLCYFDQMQPAGQGRDISFVNRAEHYVFDPKIPANGYIRQRHRIYTPFMIYKTHGSEVAPIIFQGRITDTGEIMEQLSTGSGSQLGNFPNILQAIHALYFDETGNEGRGYRRGTAGNGAGSVRRFVEVVTKQMQRIKDVYSMPWKELVEQLPSPEFDRFKEDLNDVPEIGPFVPTPNDGIPNVPEDTETSGNDPLDTDTGEDTQLIPSGPYRPFKESIASDISESLGKNIEPLQSGTSNSIWKSVDGKSKAVIRVSKYTEGEDYNYWFTCHQRDLDELKDAEESYYVLGLGDSLRFYSLDVDFFNKVVEELDPTPDRETPTWDIRLQKDDESGELFLKTKEGSFSIEKYSSLPGSKKEVIKTGVRYGVAFKRFSSVEVDSGNSNQHEINGTSAIRDILGDEKLNKMTVPVRICRSNQPSSTSTNITWYDARENHPSRTEWRLYYESELEAHENDLLLIIRDNHNPGVSLQLMVVAEGHYMENQILEILPVADIGSGKSVAVETDINLFNLL